MGEWAWAAGIAPLFGPWRLGAVQFVLQREGGFDPHRQLDLLSRHGVTNVFTTPTAMRSMMAIDDAGTRYPQRFRVVCSAGEPLNPEAIRWFREQYGLTVLDYYGMTERIRWWPTTRGWRSARARWASPPRAGDGDPRRGLQARRGARGDAASCACRRAPTRTTRSATGTGPRTPSATFGGEWFHTGDAASFDEDGYVWYEGRADDLIIAAGYRIGPFEVESACLEHPAVAEAAAVASPDERRGHVVKAFIVAARGVEPTDALAEEIQAFVRDRLSAYAYPRRIEFVDDLPKTLTGKIRRIELRQREREAARGETPLAVRRAARAIQGRVQARAPRTQRPGRAAARRRGAAGRVRALRAARRLASGSGWSRTSRARACLWVLVAVGRAVADRCGRTARRRWRAAR